MRILFLKNREESFMYELGYFIGTVLIIGIPAFIIYCKVN